MDSLNTALQQERAAHDATREELESLQKQLQLAKEQVAELQGGAQAQVQAATTLLEASLAAKEEVGVYGDDPSHPAFDHIYGIFFWGHGGRGGGGSRLHSCMS